MRQKYSVEDSEARALAYMQEFLKANGKSLEQFNLPSVPNVPQHDSTFSYDDHLKISRELQLTLNDDQRNFFDTFYNAFNSTNPKKCRLFFIDGAAGTGKTHLYNFLFHFLKSQNIDVIACAYTGIAATLLPEGRTLHSAFKIPFNPTREKRSNITSTSHSEQYRMITHLQVLIIDEASMVSNDLLDCLNKSLKEICVDQRDFGGKFDIFGGDFRQILPVVRRGTRTDIVRSSLKSNDIWKRVRSFTLRKNMRADPQAKEFSDYLLRIGEGKLPRASASNPWIVALREDIIVPFDITTDDNELTLIHRVFPAKLTVNNVMEYAIHVIICPTNLTVMKINNRIILDILEGQIHIYLSFDEYDKEESFEMPIEHIYQLNPSGYPPHELKLKLGTIVIVLRNLSTN